MSSTNDLSDKVTENVIRENLEKFKELKLDEHYDFSAETESTIKDAIGFSNFIKSNKPLVFKINEDNVLYYTTEYDDEEHIFDIDVTKSFSKSDSWLFDKIIKVVEIFPNASSIPVSDEMSSCFICLVIASVFGETFEEEILEVSDNYNFKTWEAATVDGITFLELSTSWIQLGSKYIKMVAAAAKYALLRESRKKQVPSALQLPQETVLELNKVLREVDAIRFEYDEIKLSEIEREKLDKLDVKFLIRERDRKIEEVKKRDDKIYQVLRLMKLNSNVIPPTILLKINKEARKSALKFYKEMNPGSTSPSSREERLSVKKVEDKLKRSVRRAYLNKLFARESEKFINSPDTYVAPDFV